MGVLYMETLYYLQFSCKSETIQKQKVDEKFYEHTNTFYFHIFMVKF